LLKAREGSDPGINPESFEHDAISMHNAAKLRKSSFFIIREFG